jgi:hypothetical protein
MRMGRYIQISRRPVGPINTCNRLSEQRRRVRKTYLLRPALRRTLRVRGDTDRKLPVNAAVRIAGTGCRAEPRPRFPQNVAMTTGLGTAFAVHSPFDVKLHMDAATWKRISNGCPLLLIARWSVLSFRPLLGRCIRGAGVSHVGDVG